MGIKKGATLCSNLVNLKSNTMKNTLQRYSFKFNTQVIGKIKQHNAPILTLL